MTAPQRRAAWIVAPAIVGLGASWLVMLWLAYSGMSGIDANELKRDAGLAKASVALTGTKLSTTAADYSFWNDAIQHLVLTTDPEWANKNIGSYLQQTFGVSGAYVVAADGTTTIAFENGKQVAADVMSRFPSGIGELIKTSEDLTKGKSVPASGLFSSGGQIHVVSASVFKQEAPSDGLDLPSPRPALVLTRALDSALMADFAQTLQLPGLEVRDAPRAGPSVPLTDSAGRTLGYLTWEARPKGMIFLADVAAPVTATIILVSVFVYLFVSRATELIRTEDDLRRASVVKSEFLANMSHEFRTPLNAIIGFGEFMRHNPRESLSPTQAEYADHIISAGRHLLDLVNDVLDIAKIEAGKDRLDIVTADLADIVTECVAMTSAIAAKRGIAVINELNGAAPLWVRCDAVRMRQVVLNLLSNATKYNKDGGTISVSAAKTDDGAVRLTVADTGIGIPESLHARVFEPFDRLDVNVAKEVEGIGVGLAVTRMLIRNMGGDIGFTSTAGKGSAFWFTVPAPGAEAAG